MTSEILFSRRTFAGARFAERSTGFTGEPDCEACGHTRWESVSIYWLIDWIVFHILIIGNISAICFDDTVFWENKMTPKTGHLVLISASVQTVPNCFIGDFPHSRNVWCSRGCCGEEILQMPYSDVAILSSSCHPWLTWPWKITGWSMFCNLIKIRSVDPLPFDPLVEI